MQTAKRPSETPFWLFRRPSPLRQPAIILPFKPKDPAWPTNA
ncbi:hypothetical protein NEIELOOT_02763 [Neisseria elongata subsp. glycolytica ATCC 29315]|uniref:Uncharacterized protein n=1 Tax=Neisseria elongata subsp. glycolytica ATCC 29315 TaxID=546263 RepID=D4DUT0_NEIEG|nr:hypothetical protein NEIELOOT_02763 [Neisseria elongata subsp. glycolytica ATCC 29315]